MFFFRAFRFAAFPPLWRGLSCIFLFWALPLGLGGEEAAPTEGAVAAAPPFYVTSYGLDLTTGRSTTLGRAPLPGGRPAAQRDLPFAPGEVLEFTFHWGWFTVGTGELRTEGPVLFQGQPAWRVRLLLRTSGVAEGLYPIRNNLESFLSYDLRRSLHYFKEQREKNDHDEEAAIFDWGARTVYYRNRKETKPAIALPEEAIDPLSLFLFLRQTGLRPGQSLERAVTDGEKVVPGRLVLETGEQRLRTDAGEFTTWLCVPEVRHIGGIFKKSRDARLDVWVSNCARRYPVKIRGKVKVGTFEAQLASITPGQWW